MDIFAQSTFSGPMPPLFMVLNVHSNLLRLIRESWKLRGGGMGTYVLLPTRYTVTTRMALH